MNGNHGNQEELSLSEELQLLEKEYTVVAMATLASLEQNRVPHSCVYQHLLSPPQQAVRSKYRKLIERRVRPFGMVSTKRLFQTFSPYCDFLNPDLLDHIVEYFGDEISCSIIAMYMKRLREFRRKTPLCAMAGKWVAITPPGYVEMALDTDKSWRRKSLEELEAFRSHPSRMQWFLKRVERDGLEVVFSVPKGVWLFQDDLVNLGKSGVLRVMGEGRSVVKLVKELLEDTTGGEVGVSNMFTVYIQY